MNRVVLLVILVAAGCRKRVPLPAVTTQPEAEARSDEACPRDSMFAPVVLPMEAYEARTNPGVARFSERQTSKEAPFETCMVGGELELLTRLVCDDGSNPFGDDLRAAHAARLGSMGMGGRCGSIIDLYRVPCPERSYEVFIDMYVCPEGAGQ